jgi:hypothetical protein
VSTNASLDEDGSDSTEGPLRAACLAHRRGMFKRAAWQWRTEGGPHGFAKRLCPTCHCGRIPATVLPILQPVVILFQVEHLTNEHGPGTVHHHMLATWQTDYSYRLFVPIVCIYNDITLTKLYTDIFKHKEPKMHRVKVVALDEKFPVCQIIAIKILVTLITLRTDN